METLAKRKSALKLVAPLVAASISLLIASTLLLPLPARCLPSSADNSANNPTPAAGIVPPADSVNSQQVSQQNYASIEIDASQQEIIQTALDGKLPEAEKLLEKLIDNEKDHAKEVDLMYMLAALEKMQEKCDEARGHLEFVLQHQPPAMNSEGQLRHALLLKRIGDCFYGERKYKDALTSYNSALIISAALPIQSRILADLYESAMGIMMSEKRYAEAQSYGQKLLAVTTERAKSGLWDDAGVLFWAQMQMLNLYRHMKNPPDEEPIRKLVAGSLENLMKFRFSLESQGKLPTLAERKEVFAQHYISEAAPKSAAEYIWLAGEFKLRTMPVIGWMPAQTPPRAAILCVHGLGLDNQAFTPFGYQMSSKGYAVYAMDVRGFGAWLNTPGQEDLRLNEAVNDVGSIIGLISQRQKDVPIFLLGESMGGAIALRAGAKYSKDLHGVISSVPSAERFQARKMGLTVAVHFLKNPNKPFRVGDMVARKATDNSKLREVWQDDLKAKMDMSPKELMRFAVFMRETKLICGKLNTMPLFFVQGLRDRLVKPRGTYELFDAVTSPDKNLFIIGNEEHLIFETFNQSPMLLDALTTWIEKRAARPANTPYMRPASESTTGTGADSATPAKGEDMSATMGSAQNAKLGKHKTRTKKNASKSKPDKGP